jgi:GT2 family glycosyltransferase
MADERLIGIVTVTYNSAEVLGSFFDSIWQQTHRNFQLFAIDNASKDATLAMLKACPDVRLRTIANQENRGVAAGNNQGIRAALEAGCDSVLLINNDTVFDADLLEKLDAAIASHHVEMACPKILYFDEPDRIWAAGGRFQRWLGYRSVHIGDGELDRGQYDRECLVTYVPTCCVLIDKEVFSVVGMMDERYFVYTDDTDFMYRAMKAQIRLLYLPEAKLLHKVGRLTGGEESSFATYYGTRNRAFFHLKHFGLITALSFMGLKSIYYTFAALKPSRSISWLSLKQRALWKALTMSRSSTNVFDSQNLK